ncbi:hypothetical protein SAMN03159353_1009184 [Cedecea sp. NFIX57]|nr:hypothetical protein SAMN03159353_1009184 [Cedecea sp. NFIX57]
MFHCARFLHTNPYDNTDCTRFSEATRKRTNGVIKLLALPSGSFTIEKLNRWITRDLCYGF